MARSVESAAAERLKRRGGESDVVDRRVVERVEPPLQPARRHPGVPLRILLRDQRSQVEQIDERWPWNLGTQRRRRRAGCHARSPARRSPADAPVRSLPSRWGRSATPAYIGAGADSASPVLVSDRLCGRRCVARGGSGAKAGGSTRSIVRCIRRAADRPWRAPRGTPEIMRILGGLRPRRPKARRALLRPSARSNPRSLRPGAECVLDA